MPAKKKENVSPEPMTVRLKSLKIADYKGIDNLEISFESPLLKSDPFVTVIGSQNGLGKTSILECCALLLLGLSGFTDLRELRPFFEYLDYSDLHFDPLRLLVRYGAKQAHISGVFSINGHEHKISISCSRERITVDDCDSPDAFRSMFRRSKYESREEFVGLFLSLLGVSGEPMIFPPFLYFNSYRKIHEGNPELGMMLHGERHWRRFPSERYGPLSTFKMEIIRAFMGRQGLFESMNESEADTTLKKLNALVEEFADCEIGKLRDDKRGVELRVHRKENVEKSYPFDALSSGQKEIISTLFMIWKYTNKQSGIVLIDEPELHLNAEWHRSFIRQLGTLQPSNQYIIATHSEHIFDSVDERNRLLLQPTRT